MKLIICFALLSLANVITPQNTQAGSIVLNWNPSASPQVAGYNVYYGTSSGKYLYKLNAGRATSLTISDLALGTLYYFAATAYDSTGKESGYSPELKVTVSVALAMTRSDARAPSLLEFPVEPNHWYEIQASANCQVWTSIWHSGIASSNAVMKCIDRESLSLPSRFYRLVVH